MSKCCKMPSHANSKFSVYISSYSICLYNLLQLASTNFSISYADSYKVLDISAKHMFYNNWCHNIKKILMHLCDLDLQYVDLNNSVGLLQKNLPKLKYFLKIKRKKYKFSCINIS